MVDDIRHWLEALGFGEYADAFEENLVDADVLPSLTSDDLKDIGVQAVGVRRKLLNAIAALNNGDDAQGNTFNSSLPNHRPAVADRRQLAVMFCDLVGSTALSRQLDPEDLRDIIRRYQDAVASTVMRYGGHVAKYLGDGVLVYFGWPQAFEDQAERAVRAGLDAVKAVNGITSGDSGRLEARVGIATGQVVVGDLVGDSGRDAEAVTGETPNLAARLQGEAETSQVVISGSTRDLVGATFELADLGPRTLKGYDEPVPAWRVVQESRVEDRFESTGAGAPLRIVGREQEIALLYDRWDLAKNGEGQAVLLAGEAGIGKSRIIDAVRTLTAVDRDFHLYYQCSPLHTNSAFHPVTQHLERAAGFDAHDNDEAKLDKLEHLISVADGDGGGDGDARSVVALFASLLSLNGEIRYGPNNLTPEQRRDRTFAALVGHVLALARRRPVLFVLEDAHWIDPTTLDYIGEVIAQTADTAVFVLATHRPDFDAPWQGYPHLTSLTLNRLSRAQTTEIVETVGEGRLDDAVVEHIVARADGVPLFIEELTKSVLEAGGSSNDPVALEAIPPTLQASLTARLDRLGDAKRIAQIAAAIGREFSHDLIRAVSGDNDDALANALNRLMEAELVFRIATPRGSIYSFKHALIQEVAHEGMLKSSRAELHAKIADILKTEFPATVETEPEVLARHYSLAGMAEPAIESWRRAGALSVASSANVEAVNQFNSALALVETLPDGFARDRMELELRVASGGPLLMTKGHAAPDVGQAYARARELCEKIGPAPELIPVLFGLWRYYVGRGDCDVTRDLGRQILDIGEEAGDQATIVLGRYGLGYALFCHGQLEAARDVLEAGYEAYDQRMRENLSFRLGQDPGVACLAYLALALWVLGYPEQARLRTQEALALAEELSHPFSQAYARSLACQVLQLRGEVAEVRAMSDHAVEIAREQGFGVWIASPTIFRGWSRSQLGEPDDGAQEADEAAEAVVVAGMSMRRPYYLALVAEGQMSAERWDEARATLEQAQSVAAETGESWSEPELTRLQGVLAARDETETAEALLRSAVTLAREKHAKSWELRAATSLARLLHKTGQDEEAETLLRPVYDWFTEGLDTPDLKEAKALLDALA
jgi:class 3 adenylate cyclase/predicted ATPase